MQVHLILSFLKLNSPNDNYFECRPSGNSEELKGSGINCDGYTKQI